MPEGEQMGTAPTEEETLEMMVERLTKANQEQDKKIREQAERLSQLTIAQREELERAKLRPIQIKKRTDVDKKVQPKHVQLLQQANASYLAEINKYNTSFHSSGLPNASLVNSLSNPMSATNANFSQGTHI